jgi:RNA polymerase sigma-70 factor (ECF subfamily)
MSYLTDGLIDEERFPALVAMKRDFGFVPNFFRGQVLRPDLIDAESTLVDGILIKEGALSRAQKEFVFLVCSAANLSTYCVTAHCEIVRLLGIQGAAPEQIAIDYRSANLSAVDTALLDFASKLNKTPTKIGPADVDALRAHGFADQQILETVLVVGLAKFANLVAEGLGTVPDFDGAAIDALLHRESRVNPAAVPARPKESADPDEMAVARVRAGDLDAFEELVRRHERRVFRTLVGITGNQADAEDGSQRTFLKAYEKLSSFEGASTFGTWLTRIAINEGLERVRGRRSFEPIDGDDDRPAPCSLQAWTDDPETAYARAELKEIVEREVLKLPPRYRVAVLLRDLQELSTEEAAAALGLGVATLKTHLHRGRMLLREALTPYFVPKEREEPRRAQL